MICMPERMAILSDGRERVQASIAWRLEGIVVRASHGTEREYQEQRQVVTKHGRETKGQY